MKLTERQKFDLEMTRQLVLGEIPARNARKYPDRDAVVFDGHKMTWCELDERSNRLGNALLNRGIKRGDKIAVFMRNRREIVEIYFAAAKIGAVNVPVNIRLAPREIAHVLKNSESRAVIFEDFYRETVLKIKNELPGIDTFILVEGHADTDMDAYEAALSAADPSRPLVWIDDNDPAFILYTSGTTGLPKGAVMSHKNFTVQSLSVLLELFQGVSRNSTPFPEVLKILLTAPLFHVAAISNLIRFTMLGSTVHVHEFEPRKVLETVQREGIMAMFGVPTMWRMLLDFPDFKQYDVSSLRYTSYGAAPMLPGLMEDLQAAFPNAALAEYFGQTEMAPNVVTMKHQHALRKKGSVGLPLFNVDFRIVDDGMNDVPTGQVGEAVYRGPNMFKGYYKNEAADDEAFFGGWFHSGDLVRCDEEGFVYVVDRKKDMIVSGGENIYSAEIEELLMSHPKIAEAAAVGVPDPKWGRSGQSVRRPQGGPRDDSR